MADFELGDGFNLGNGGGISPDSSVSSPIGNADSGSGGNNPLIAMLIGIGLFIGSFFLISYNEHRAVDAVRALMWAQDQTLTVNPAQINAANEGHFIAVQGNATASQPIVDNLFQISAANALRLQRKVEMYQWSESSHTTNHVTNYSYNAGWHEGQIDSSHFRDTTHQNPAMPFQTVWQDNPTSTLGAFHLNGQILYKLSQTQPFPLPANYQTSPGTRITEPNQLYHGGDPANPQIGDMRVSFYIVPTGPASVAGLQTQNFIGEGFKPGSGFGILLAEQGLKSVETLYADEQNRQSLITWALRAGALIMMWGGIYMLFSPLVWLASFVPFLDWVVSGFAGTIATIVALPVFIIAEISFWLSVRPVTSVVLIVISCGIAYLVLTRHRQKLAAGAASSPVVTG